jgi:hypothetical protein
MKSSFIFAFTLLFSQMALASFEGSWVGSGGSLKNNRGYEMKCESVRLEALGDVGSYRVTFEASCGGIHYLQKFSDVTASQNAMVLNDPWGQVTITKIQNGIHASGFWQNISWPNEAGTVDATLEIDLRR